jgi:hypothetical protein
MVQYYVYKYISTCSLGERIILKWILQRQDGVVWAGLIWLSTGTTRTREYGDKPSGSITCWEIPEWLTDWRLLKKRSAPWS